MKLLHDNIDESKWDKQHNILLSLRELQVIHDALWNICYEDLEDAETTYHAKDSVYNIDTLNTLCSDLYLIVKELNGLYNDFEEW